MWGSKSKESRPGVEMLQDMVPWADYRLCLRALTVSGGDVSRAVDYLLSKEAALGGGKSKGGSRKGEETMSKILHAEPVEPPSRGPEQRPAPIFAQADTSPLGQLQNSMSHHSCQLSAEGALLRQCHSQLISLGRFAPGLQTAQGASRQSSS